MNTPDSSGAVRKVSLNDALSVVVFTAMIITIISLGLALIVEPRAALVMFGMLVLEFVAMIFLALLAPKRRPSRPI